MKVLIASDHAGFKAKEELKKTLNSMRISYQDYGTSSEGSVDYTDYAGQVAKAIAHGDADRGILICGTGIGMEIAANKVHGIRAALAWNDETAKLAREHNNANIVTVGARTTPQETINSIVEIFLTTEFEGGERHNRRIQKISELENE